MAHYGDEIDGNALHPHEPDPYVVELENAVLVMWGELDYEGVRALRDEQPDVVALAQHLHERYDHGLGDDA